MTEEAVAYHTANLHFQSDYSKLAKAWAKFGSWQTFCNNSNLVLKQSIFDNLAKSNIELRLSTDPSFPCILREIPLPPFGIYLRGELAESKRISIVGTRKANDEGLDLAEKFGRELAESKFTIVSGLAIGIDAAAHRGALQADGKTIAVLACGLDQIYPRLHLNLAETILTKGGCLISEYPPTTPPLPYRFLERNRIVSGLSEGTLVIQASQRSGSLATARFALDQNREVMVIPGSVRNSLYSGSNKLIQSGATLVTSPADILSALGYAENKPEISEEEEIIIKFIGGNPEPPDIDKIAEQTKLKNQKVVQILSYLIIKGLVHEEMDGYHISK